MIKAKFANTGKFANTKVDNGGWCDDDGRAAAFVFYMGVRARVVEMTKEEATEVFVRISRKSGDMASHEIAEFASAALAMGWPIRKTTSAPRSGSRWAVPAASSQCSAIGYCEVRCA